MLLFVGTRSGWIWGDFVVVVVVRFFRMQKFVVGLLAVVTSYLPQRGWTSIPAASHVDLSHLCLAPNSPNTQQSWRYVLVPGNFVVVDDSSSLMSLFFLLLFFLLSALAGAGRCLGGCRWRHGSSTAHWEVAIQRVLLRCRGLGHSPVLRTDELTAPCRTGVLTNAPFAGLLGLYRNLPPQVTRGEGREGRGGKGG